jgi:hypothetical protein
MWFDLMQRAVTQAYLLTELVHGMPWPRYSEKTKLDFAAAQFLGHFPVSYRTATPVG